MGPIAGLKIGGVFEIECRDRDGNLKWRDTAKNIVVNEGLNKLLDVMFHGVAAIGTWYVGLWGGSAPTSASTLAVPVFTEFAGYTGNRQEFVEGAASGQSISNSGNAASFAVNGSGTVKGAFIASAASGSTGTLFCAAAFSQGDKNVSNGDTVNVTYTLSAADDGA